MQAEKRSSATSEPPSAAAASVEERGGMKKLVRSGPARLFNVGWGVLRFEFDVTATLVCMGVCFVLMLLCTGGSELFPGSSVNTVHAGIALADGFVRVGASPLASTVSNGNGATIPVAYDRSVATDRNPAVRPAFLSTTDMQARSKRDASTFSRMVRHLSEPPSSDWQDASTSASSRPYTPLSYKDFQPLSLYGPQGMPQPHPMTTINVSNLRAEEQRSSAATATSSSGSSGGGGGGLGSSATMAEKATPDAEGDDMRRATVRPLPKLHTPLALYHTRLHTYTLYTAQRELRTEQLRRLQYYWADEVMRPPRASPPPPPRRSVIRTKDGDVKESGAVGGGRSRWNDNTARDFRRAHLEAELRQTRFAALVQRTYMRALRHADAMRMESLHYLRVFALTVPGLADAWKGDDYCRWLGVTCEVVHVPLYKLMDERHGYVQAYSRDVLERLPPAWREDVTRRYDALIDLGDKVNVNGRIRDEASGFAQRTRDLMLNQAVRNANNGATWYANENGDNMRDAQEMERLSSTQATKRELDLAEGAGASVETHRRPRPSGAEEASASASSSSSPPRPQRRTLLDLTGEESVAAREGAIALWYLLSDNATGTGLPSDTWTKAVWCEYHGGAEGGRGFAEESVDVGDGGRPLGRLRHRLRRLWRRLRGLKDTQSVTPQLSLLPSRWQDGRSGQRAAAPPATLASARLTRSAQQVWYDEHTFPFTHKHLAASLGVAPRVYYGSIEGRMNPEYLARPGTSTQGKRPHESGFVSPFTAPTAAPVNMSRFGGLVLTADWRAFFTAVRQQYSALTEPTPLRPPLTAGVPSAAMDSSLREMHEALADTGFSQVAGKGRAVDVDTVPVTVFALNLRDLGLAGFLPRRTDVRGALEDCDGWGDGDDCHGAMFDRSAVLQGKLKSSPPPPPTSSPAADAATAAAAASTVWVDHTTRGPSPFFPAEFQRRIPVEYPAENSELLPFIAEDEARSRYRPPPLPGKANRTVAKGAAKSDAGGSEKHKGKAQVSTPVARADVAARRAARQAATEAETRKREEDRAMRLFVEEAAAEHGVALNWEHVLQGEVARRRWLAEESFLLALRRTSDRPVYLHGPRSPRYWEVERPIDTLLELRATVPGRGYPSVAATDLGATLRRTLTRLEYLGARSQHHDLTEYFGFIASLGHFRGESDNPLAPFPPFTNGRIRARLAEWGLDLSRMIEDNYVYASRLARPLAHVDDDTLLGHIQPELVPITELDVSRNPSLVGMVPPMYFRFPLLRFLDVSGSGIFFRIASRNLRAIVNMLSHDVLDEHVAKHRDEVAFSGSLGNYGLRPVMPFVSRSFVEAFMQETGSHRPQQSGGSGGGGSGVAGGKQLPTFTVKDVLPSEYHQLPADVLAREGRAPVILATNNGDLRVTNALVRELGETSRGEWVWSTASRTCSAAGLAYLFGFRAPVY